MEMLRLYQADIMLVLSGICGSILIFVYMINSITRKRKFILMQLEICVMFLLIADRQTYLCRGGGRQFTRLVDGAHLQLPGLFLHTGGDLQLQRVPDGPLYA